MLFLVVGAFLIILFLPFIVMAGKAEYADKRMLARFAMLRSNTAGNLSSEAVDDLLKQSDAQTTGWLMSLLGRISTAMRLNELILQADSSSTIKKVFYLSLASGAAGALVVFAIFKMWLLALAAGCGTSYVPLAVLKFRRKRRIQAMDKVLPEVIDMMTRALRAGHSLPAAIGIIAEQAAEPAKSQFSEVFRKQKFGHPMRDSLMELLARVPSQDLRVLVTGIVVQRDTGGNLTEILDRTAAVIRERLKLQGDVRVHTAQGRMTGWILCLLPVVMLVMINLVDPGYSKLLTDDSIGRKCLYAGVVLLAVGAFLIKQIVSKIEV